ncbi:MAG: hypothetical protein IJL89_08530 [Firmicutes bacterium]|nr:hypothetical protein [Bacillota bacterium]
MVVAARHNERTYKHAAFRLKLFLLLRINQRFPNQNKRLRIPKRGRFLVWAVLLFFSAENLHQEILNKLLICVTMILWEMFEKLGKR